MENGPFEDVFPIKNGDIPLLCLSVPEGTGTYLNLFHELTSTWVLFSQDAAK